MQYLLEQMRLSRYKQFGASSEKSEYDMEQLNLFNEAEAFATMDVVEPELQAVEKHYRKKRKELPSKLPVDLPVETIEHTLSEEDQVCPACAEHLHVMGKEVVRRELKLIPARAVIVGCFSHARRKFDEALNILPEKERRSALAHVGKTYCDRLFELERQFSVLPSEDRFAKRQELAKPVLDEFLLWLQKQITGKSALGNAIHYTLEQWKYLKRYLLDGRLEISNIRAERSIKPFVIGRKNFLFCNVPKGAESSAVLYSIVEIVSWKPLKKIG